MARKAKKSYVKTEIYPKGMTIRYDKEQEEQIFKMQRNMGENTMTKAFLRCPNALKMRDERIESQDSIIKSQEARIRELEEIVNTWQTFAAKLDKFVSKR